MILQIRLKGAPEGHFQNIDVPFDSMSAFTKAMEDGDIIICDRLWTESNGHRQRKITKRTDIGLTYEGIEWMMAPTVEFVGDEA